MVKSNPVNHHEKLGEEKFDWQWVNLMLEAREIGLSPNEVRAFLIAMAKTNSPK